MPAVTSFQINDQEATPVTHTFNPVQVDNGYVLWKETDIDPLIGQMKVVMEWKLPSGPSKTNENRNTKVKVRFEIPVLETLGTETSTGILPVPTVAHRQVAETTFTLPERCSTLDRKNILQMYRTILGQTLFSGTIQDYAFVY